MKHNRFILISVLILVILQLSCKSSLAQTQIKGRVENCSNCKISLLTNTYGFDLNRDIIPSSPDSYGNFVFDLLEIYVPTVVLLQVNNYKVPIYVEPNKQTWVNIQYLGSRFNYSFENELAKENEVLKEFNTHYGWVTNAQPENVYVSETAVNIKSRIYADYNSKADYLRADYLLNLHKQIREQVIYMDDVSNSFKKYMTIYAKHASSAIVYSLAINDPLLQNSDLFKILSLSYADSFNEIEKANPAFYPHLKSYGILLAKSSNVNKDDFSEYFNFTLLNIQLPTRLKEQYLIYLMRKNLNGANITVLKSTILDFAKQMNDLDNLSQLVTLYNKVKKNANGRKAPNFNLQDQHGNMVSLKSLQGENIFLAFWSSSCRPCIEGMRKSEQNKYYLQGDPIKFVYISTDINKSTWLNNSQVVNAGPNDIHLWVGKGAIDAKEYDAYTLPTYYFINEYGNFITEFPKSWEPRFIPFVRSRY